MSRPKGNHAFANAMRFVKEAVECREAHLEWLMQKGSDAAVAAYMSKPMSIADRTRRGLAMWKLEDWRRRQRLMSQARTPATMAESLRLLRTITNRR